MLTLLLLSPLSAYAQGQVSETYGLHVMRVTRLRVIVGPAGDFTLEVPKGWGFTANLAENTILLSPLGQFEPKVYSIALPPIAAMASNWLARVNQCAAIATSNPFAGAEVVQTPGARTRGAAHAPGWRASRCSRPRDGRAPTGTYRCHNHLAHS